MRKLWAVSDKIIFLIMVSHLTNVYGKPPEVVLSFEDRIKADGYPVEIHKITTEDDYILPLVHIPHGLEESKNESNNKSVVLLIHGMGGSPGTFNVLGPKKSILYYLADRGFDVWIFCSRGVIGPLPRKHKTWDWDKDAAYWLFSLDEIAKYDLAATIDDVLNRTNQQKLHLIGHSAGGNEFFALLSEKPEYNNKIKLAVSWASSPILKRADYPLMTFLSGLVNIFKGLNRILEFTKFFPQIQILRDFIRKLCADSNWKTVCIKLSWIIGSHPSILQHPDDIELISSLFPLRISLQQGFHFMDNFNSGEFRKYNFGPKKNMKLYGQKVPPKHNLSAAIIPTAFFLGPADGIVVKEDVYESMAFIPNVVMVYHVPFKKFTHTDFIFARNADQLVYEPTYRLLKDVDEGRTPASLRPPTNK